MLKGIMIFFCVGFPALSFAQEDVFTGTWQMQYKPTAASTVINMELQVAAPEKNLLYPAQLKLQCDEFEATYTLLLVKKNIRQLAIGRNKIPREETPFTIGNWTIIMNGIFDLSKDKGANFLTTERIFAKKYELPMPELNSFENKYAGVATALNNFLKDAEIRLKKINSAPWQDEQAQHILYCGKSPFYYGIIDSVQVKERDATIEFPGSKKTANGIVSVMLNGNMFIDQADLSYKKPAEEIQLDTGMNILVFFVEAYGRLPSTTGKLKLGFAQKDILMDFGNKDDVAANFIVAKIFCSPQTDEENDLSHNNIPKEYIETSPQSSTPNNNQPGKEKNDLKQNGGTVKNIPENTLLRDAKLVGSTIVTSRQITLAIWDDAVEDGDSISLSLNGKWITQGLAVKKKPKFISVTVEPGPNKITFIANNLGSIPPNTSILEVSDGKERNSFMISTNLRQNNLINIFYEYKP